MVKMNPERKEKRNSNRRRGKASIRKEKSNRAAKACSILTSDTKCFSRKPGFTAGTRRVIKSLELVILVRK